MANMARMTLITLGLLTIASLMMGSVAAHATHYSPDGKIKFVYGHLNEPAYTFVKTGLDLSIIDNATGVGISGFGTDAREGDATPKIFVSYRYGGEGGPMKNISDDFRAQHGQVGKYTHPITFTRAGLYSIVITGTINGTVLNNFVLPPAHAIEAQDEIMWPDEAQADQSARIEELEEKVAQLEGNGGAAAGIEFIPLLAVIALTLFFVRRR